MVQTEAGQWGPEAEQLRNRVNPGIARMLAGSRFYNPDRRFPPDVVRQAVQDRQIRVADFNQIAQVGEDQKREKYAASTLSASERYANWVGEIGFFLSSQASTNQQFREVLQNQLGMNVAGGVAGFQAGVRGLWNRYLRDGANISQFLQAVTAGIDPGDSDAINQRIDTARPLFCLFGGEETVQLIEDIAKAVPLLTPNRTSVANAAAARINSDFINPTQRHAYELLWEKVRVTVGANEAPALVQPLDQPNAGDQQGDLGGQVQPGTETPQQNQNQGQQETLPPQGVGATAQNERRRVETEMGERDGRQIPEHLIMEETAKQAGPFTYATINLKDKDHPDFGADRVLALPIGNGESSIIAAIDGVGSGGRYSSFAAEIVRDELTKIPQNITSKPTIVIGFTAVIGALRKAAQRIEELKTSVAQDGVNEDIRRQIGAVGTVGIICKNNNNSDTLLTVNLGDSRMYVYNPSQLKLEQISSDHTRAQEAYDRGEITKSQAFLDERKDVVVKDITIQHIDELQSMVDAGRQTNAFVPFSLPRNQDIVIFAATDGWVDNTPPSEEESDVVLSFAQSRMGGNVQQISMTKFVKSLAQKAWEKIYSNANEATKPTYHGSLYAKSDDVGIAAVFKRAEVVGATV